MKIIIIVINIIIIIVIIVTLVNKSGFNILSEQFAVALQSNIQHCILCNKAFL